MNRITRWADKKTWRKEAT